MPAELTARFHVVALLGSGGSAIVYLANDKVYKAVSTECFNVVCRSIKFLHLFTLNFTLALCTQII